MIAIIVESRIHESCSSCCLVVKLGSRWGVRGRAFSGILNFHWLPCYCVALQPIRAQCAGFMGSEHFLVLLCVVLSFNTDKWAGHTKQGPFCDSGEDVNATFKSHWMWHTGRGFFSCCYKCAQCCSVSACVTDLQSSLQRTCFNSLFQTLKWLPQDHTHIHTQNYSCDVTCCSVLHSVNDYLHLGWS